MTERFKGALSVAGILAVFVAMVWLTYAMPTQAAINVRESSNITTVLIEGNSAVVMTLSTSASQSAALEEGFYSVWASADVFVRVGPTATGVTATNGYVVRASAQPIALYVPGGSRIGAIASTGTPTLTYHKVG